ncbi:uncharacterized protein IUM83_18492 [Phytophthora cinnamomi]|uniref:uncharacterized protein n=1 Tax=Phytophthora cinnamomi TaxID=4785 RepID=UPI0035594993|nr:hypothetical protein IUM83_18492 [Phytophthora cinnamomi]
MVTTATIEYKQIMDSTVEKQQRQLEEVRRRYHSEMRELEQRCDQKWQTKVAASAAEARQCELSELRWGEKLEAAGREKAAMEQRVKDARNRLEETCRIIVALKTACATTSGWQVNWSSIEIRASPLATR